MSNQTPEWASPEAMRRDYATYLVKQTRKRMERRVRVTAIIAGVAVAAIAGVGIGVSLAREAGATTQQQINQYIRANGGIPPCKWEDGSGQPGTCVWWAGRNGNGDGHSILLVPDGPDRGDDKDVIFINGPKAVRY